MIYTLTLLYKQKGEIVLTKAVEKKWIKEEEKQQIIEDNK